MISSTKEVDDEVFKNVVQRLARICFPEGILSQLGEQILEQHMREENAPAANIRKITTLFQSEMVQRISAMVAEHLDTPAKVTSTSTVQATITASARAHSESLGGNIIDHVTASLLRLKERAPDNSAE